MKKIIAMVIAAVVSFGAFAERNVETSLSIGLGASITQSKFSVDEASGSSDVKFNSVNFSLLPVELRGVYDNNFAVMLGFETDILCSDTLKYNGKKIEGLTDESGNSFDLLAGFGYRFLNTEKFSFIASAVTGFKWGQFSAEYKNSSKESLELTQHSIALGLDLFGEFKLNQKWSIYAAVTGYANLLETHNFSNVTDNGYFDDVKRYIDTEAFSGFTIKPRIGVSYRF